MEPYKLDISLDANKVFLVKRSELDSRMDPIFYGSDLTKFNKYFPSVKLSSVVFSFKSGVGAGKQDQAEGDEGIIQIRPTNIDNIGNLKFDKNVYLPYEFKGDRLKLNDVLFNNTNSQELVGKTAILLEEKELFYSNHITRIVVDKSQVLPLYIWIILNIYQENKIFYALCTNWNNQSGVGLELLKSLPIPLPPIEVQENIVSIIQNAYTQKKAKEAKAKELLDSIDVYLLKELGISLPEKDNSLEARIFTTKFSEVGGSRLDPDYYQIEYKKLEESIRRGKYPIDELRNNSDLFSGKTPASTEYSDESTEFPIIKVGSYIDNNIEVSKQAHAISKQPYSIRFGDVFILSAAHQAEYVGRHIKVLEFNPIVPTSFVGELLCVRPNFEKINYQYLFSLLTLNIYKTLINREKTGQTSHVYSKDLKFIEIPLPPLEKQNKIAEHIADLRTRAKALQEEAEQILAKAKQQVEQIILG